jgi:hypothetical protein
MRITIMMVEDLFNSYVSNPRDSDAKLEECYVHLMNIANGEYKPKDLKEDIETHAENERSSR